MSLFSQPATGSSNIATTIAPGRRWQLEEIRIHLSAAGGANNLTVTMDAGNGSAYDCVLLTQDMTSVTDLVWRPTRPILMNHASDEIDIAWTNGSSRTYGLEVMYSPIA